MNHSSELIARDIGEYLRLHEQKQLLRFITCGSVDDGKSTLIGRLLYESKMIFEDQFDALRSDSRKFGTQGEEIDFALLVDGLAAEREQGITIDVAYRFFATEKRKFIVADTPGHEQYTRNMVTGASTADAAVLMVDARKGILTQTRRHSFLVSLLGIRNVVVAVNKMDLVGYDSEVFTRISLQYREFAGKLGLDGVTFIPMSALKGDNIISASASMPWYEGPSLMEFLESAPVDDAMMESSAFRMPVQWVNRPHLDFRGFSGTVSAGAIALGDRVRIQPSGRESRVDSIVVFGASPQKAVAGESVTLTLADEVDVSRGDVISSAVDPAEVADQFETMLVWMSSEPMLPGRPYLLKIGAATVTASVTEIKYQVNVNTLEHLAAKKLELNSIACCNVMTDRAVAFDPYATDRNAGGFILIDRMTHATVGAGMIRFALRRSQNIHIQHLDVDRRARSLIKHQKPCALWFTGISGSGKSSVANMVEKKLLALGRHTYLLDGDNVRHGLNKDLGFTDEDRVENIRRVGEVARLMVDAGLIVMTAFISPFRSERLMARSLFGNGEFLEVFMDTPLAVAEVRDPKGLYKKARSGQLKNFTGIDSPYEAPENPEITLESGSGSIEEMADRVIEILRVRGNL
jgi:bifunctional enzyme CysN/CysC